MREATDHEHEHNNKRVAYTIWVNLKESREVNFRD